MPAKQLIALQQCNPEREAEMAYKKDDMRFIGLLGNAVVIPGVGRSSAEEDFIKRVGVKILCGSTDYTQSPLVAQIGDLGVTCPTKYNHHLLVLWAANNR